MTNPFLLSIYRALLSFFLVLASQAAPAQQAVDRFEDDAEERARAVNEGELVFLEKVPAGRVPRTRNRLVLSPQSLADGWVRLEQCQENLDPVPAMEIVYLYDAMRHLRIDSFRGMGRAWVEGRSIQMANARDGAAICVSADVRILHPAEDGRYALSSGPFHRRFLDGYYPLHLDYRVAWPPGHLALESVEPRERPGLAVEEGPGALHIETLFEGRLAIRLLFRASKGEGP